LKWNREGIEKTFSGVTVSFIVAVNQCENHNFKLEFFLYCMFTAETAAVLNILIGGWYMYVHFICSPAVAYTETVVA
jgi:hypothetical protein